MEPQRSLEVRNDKQRSSNSKDTRFGGCRAPFLGVSCARWPTGRGGLAHLPPRPSEEEARRVLPFVRLFPNTLVGLPSASASSAFTNLLEETSVGKQKIRKSPSKTKKI